MFAAPAVAVVSDYNDDGGGGVALVLLEMINDCCLVLKIGLMSFSLWLRFLFDDNDDDNNGGGRIYLFIVVSSFVFPLFRKKSRLIDGISLFLRFFLV